MAIKARDQMITQLQHKLDAVEAALHSTNDDLEARTNLCDLLQVQLRQMAEESATKDTVIDALNVKTARLFEELDRANTDLRAARKELSSAHASLEESTIELTRLSSSPDHSAPCFNEGALAQAPEATTTSPALDVRQLPGSSAEAPDKHQEGASVVAEIITEVPVDLSKIVGSPEWQASVEKFCTRSKNWQQRNHEICSDLSKWTKLNSEHFAAAHQFMSRVVDQVNAQGLDR